MGVSHPGIRRGPRGYCFKVCYQVEFKYLIVFQGFNNLMNTGIGRIPIRLDTNAYLNRDWYSTCALYPCQPSSYLFAVIEAEVSAGMPCAFFSISFCWSGVASINRTLTGSAENGMPNRSVNGKRTLFFSFSRKIQALIVDN